MRTGTINATNPHANAPTYGLNLPRFQGPGLNLLPTKKTRMQIGIVKATKAPVAAIEKSAATATGPPKIRSVASIPITVLKQTALTGVRVRWLTRLIHQEHGKQPSRA